MFVDIHSHVLNGIDDGSDSIKTSLEMLKIAKDEGISKIITTPHFIYGAINNTNEYIMSKFSKFKEMTEEQGINIELYPGSEVFICPETSSLVIEDIVCRLNASKYILIEFPMQSVPAYAEDVLFQLQLQGYKPIIAHPERNKVFQQYPGELHKFVERGILTQVNSSSISKLYGRSVEKVAMKFIEAKLVHLVATDAHTSRGRSPRMLKAYERVKEVCGKIVADKLFVGNGTAIIENRDFQVEMPEKIRNRGLTFIMKMFKTEPSYHI